MMPNMRMDIPFRDILIALTSVYCILGITRGSYRKSIPNGNYPVSPYDESTWPGNIESNKKIPWNCFDFHLNESNYVWRVVCPLDSDGDGGTNGYELGDPACVWNGTIRNRYRARSHPGVCEPPGSEKCKRVGPLPCKNKTPGPITTLLPTTTRNSTSTDKDDENMKYVIIGVCGGAIIFVLIIIIIGICYYKT